MAAKQNLTKRRILKTCQRALGACALGAVGEAVHGAAPPVYPYFEISADGILAVLPSLRYVEGVACPSCTPAEGWMEDLSAFLLAAKRSAAPSGYRAHGPVAALPDSRYCTMRSASSGPESADQTAFDGPQLARTASSATAAEDEDCGPLLHLTATRGSGQGPLKPGFVSGSGSSWLLQWISSLELDNMSAKCPSTEDDAAAVPGEAELPWLIAAKLAAEAAAPQDASARSNCIQPAPASTKAQIPGEPSAAGSPDVSPFAKASLSMPLGLPEGDAASVSSPRSMHRVGSCCSLSTAASASSAKVNRPRWNGSTRVERRPSQPSSTAERGLRRVASSRSLAPPSRMSSGIFAPLSRMDSGSLAPPSRMNSGSLAPPSRTNSGSLAPPVRMNSGSLAPPSRMNSVSFALDSMGPNEPRAAVTSVPAEGMQPGNSDVAPPRVLGRILSGITFEPMPWDVEGSLDGSPFALLQHLESFGSDTSARSAESAAGPATDSRAGDVPAAPEAPSSASDSKGSGKAGAANRGPRPTPSPQQERPRTVQRSFSRFKEAAGQPASEDSFGHRGNGSNSSAAARSAAGRPNISGTWGPPGSSRQHAAAAHHRSASSPAAPVAAQSTARVPSLQRQAPPRSTSSSVLGAAGATSLTDDAPCLLAPEGASQSEGIDCVIDPMDAHLDTLNRLLADLAACKEAVEVLCRG